MSEGLCASKLLSNHLDTSVLTYQDSVGVNQKFWNKENVARVLESSGRENERITSPHTQENITQKEFRIVVFHVLSRS
jgi:hypothetical protein